MVIAGHFNQRAILYPIGPGATPGRRLTNWLCQIAVPDDPSSESGIGLRELNRDLKEGLDEGFLELYDSGERILRLILFCERNGRTWIGWDPEEVSDARRREYGIYEWTGRDGTVTQVAGSFSQFIADVCLGPAPPGWDDERFGTHRMFDPCYEKSGP